MSEVASLCIIDYPSGRELLMAFRGTLVRYTSDTWNIQGVSLVHYRKVPLSVGERDNRLYIKVGAPHTQ